MRHKEIAEFGFSRLLAWGGYHKWPTSCVTYLLTICNMLEGLMHHLLPVLHNANRAGSKWCQITSCGTSLHLLWEDGMMIYIWWVWWVKETAYAAISLMLAADKKAYINAWHNIDTLWQDYVSTMWYIHVTCTWHQWHVFHPKVNETT